MSSTELTGRDPSTGRPVAVLVTDGMIASIGPGPAAEEVWLAPGLIDLQVNGFCGHDVNGAPDPAAVVAMVHALFSIGVTTVVPTVITASEEQIVLALRAIAAARAADPLVAHAVPYAHVEGPYLSGEDGPRGVHPSEHIRAPSVAEFVRWQRTSGDLVGVVTLSPHFAESSSYIADLASRGVHVAIGHTHATPEQILAAGDAGATLSTHLGNGSHTVLPRHPNYLWAQLADDRLNAGFIADGHHLSRETLIAMLRAKSLDRSFLVSDAVALAGSPPGSYSTPVGGTVELTADGRLEHGTTGMLAGAARSLADGVANVARLGPFSLGQAVRLATSSPGRFCGGRGVLRVGAPADLVTFRWQPGDPTLAVEQVLVGGQSPISRA
ncbi:N-acetylglucosamine-6-phosphate deacetylase [Tenggerimyces flavus]|uniref:N-acetylglucosamine-6-phosphate deacetylase n=1 Tax=Tenggerimyces flavus TaxID=1708749 RepID=A0ABV7YE34_9ACTN|nr:amidohydrolase family protein [Tenggerimyces flavus]MBM7787115.1 N-acetylglucosamine-6-phosphate deacetylase [Tenggerimyces flavus]